MSSRQSMLRGLVVGLVMACSMTAVMHAAVYAAGVEASKEEPATVITLKHAQPSYMMRLLGLYTNEDVLNGKKAAWERVDGSPGLAVNGVDSIKPGEREKTLAIRGSKVGIDELKGIVGKLDIEPKLVAQKAEFYSISPDSIGHVGISAPATKDDSFTVSFAEAALLSDLRIKLADARLNELPVTGLSNWPIHLLCRTVATKADAPLSGAGIEYTTVPRINADGSITLYFDIKEWDMTNPREPRSRQIRTNRRISPGQGLILLGGANSDGKIRLITITATVLN